MFAADIVRFPIYEIWLQATRSGGAAIVFMLILFVAGVVALVAIQQTASRLTWSFARDNAVIGSKYLGRIHTGLNVPIWSLLANNSVVFIIGCIFLGSSTAFNAILSTGLILQQLTYAIPAALLMYQKRSSRFLPNDRPFRLYNPIGWAANFLTVVFAIIVLIFYSLPVVLPVNASNMSKPAYDVFRLVHILVANCFQIMPALYLAPWSYSQQSIGSFTGENRTMDQDWQMHEHEQCRIGSVTHNYTTKVVNICACI